MKAIDVKFAVFSFGMGAAIASSLISIYILVVNLMGRQSLVYERNPVVAVGEIFLLVFAVATCVISTEIFQKYQKSNGTRETAKK